MSDKVIKLVPHDKAAAKHVPILAPDMTAENVAGCIRDLVTIANLLEPLGMDKGVSSAGSCLLFLYNILHSGYTFEVVDVPIDDLPDKCPVLHGLEEKDQDEQA